MQKWEYLFLQVDKEIEIKPTLNRAGEDGWELVTVTTMTGTHPEGRRTGPGYVDTPWFRWDMFFKRLMK